MSRVSAPLAPRAWEELCGEVLGIDPQVVVEQAGSTSFAVLGGGSLAAMRLVGAAETRLGRAVDLGALLTGRPLADVLAAATAAVPVPDAPAGPRDDLHPLLETQQGPLLAEKFSTSTAWHLLHSAELRGDLDVPTLRAALRRLTDRHEMLRTTFVRRDRRTWQRVLPAWEPTLVVRPVTPPPGGDPVEAVHRTLERTTRDLLDPAQRPGFHLTLSRFARDHHLLSLVVHHALADGWAVGLFFRELVEAYDLLRAGTAGPVAVAPTARLLPARRAALAASGRLAELTRGRVAALRGVPTVLELPADRARPRTFDGRGARLVFGLPPAARDACERLAAHAGVSHTTVLLAAWSVVLGRRSGRDTFLVATTTTRRPTAALMDVLGPCSSITPVRCDLPGDRTVTEHLRATRQELADAVTASEVPFASLVEALVDDPDERRPPLTQVLFSAQHELVPGHVPAAGLDVRLHEGHCGGTVAELGLFVLSWCEQPRLAVEFASSVHTAGDAAELADALAGTCEEMLAHLDEPLRTVRGMSAAQRARSAELRDGPPVPVPGDDLWVLLERRLRRHATRLAVDDPDSGVRLTHGGLLAAVEQQCALLAAAGVRAGDHVVVALPRSAAEIVAVLACLRHGSPYVALPPGAPPARTAAMLATARPAAVIGTPGPAAAVAALAPERCTVVAPADPGGRAGDAVPPPAPPDPDRVAYLLFTSGSTGDPKAVRVAGRGVVRLVADQPDIPLTGDDRFLRFVSLSFDVSVFEIMVPLVRGAALVVCPPGVLAPGAIAAFVAAQQVTAAYFSAGVFRVLADERPDAFDDLRWLVVGGDVVPAPQVRLLLERCPGLRVCNAYGPTEHTVFATMHTLADPADVDDPLPIGRPMAGNGTLVLDAEGLPVPPGGLGELCLLGPGLAIDYHRAPEATARAFPTQAGGERYYRTGDVVHRDGAGLLRFHGRHDRQVKIAGIRVDLDEVRSRLLEHADVRDALVLAVGDATTRRVLAAVVTRSAPDLHALREFVAATVPAGAVPALWAPVDAVPVTAAGKPDHRELERRAVPTPGPPTAR